MAKSPTPPSPVTFSKARMARAFAFVIGLALCSTLSLLFEWPQHPEQYYETLLQTTSEQIAAANAALLTAEPTPETINVTPEALPASAAVEPTAQPTLVAVTIATPTPAANVPDAPAPTPTASEPNTPQATPSPAPTEPPPTPTLRPTPPPPPAPIPAAQTQPVRVQPHQPDLFDELMLPFIAEAAKRRAQRLKSEPAYAGRLDPELNKTRINFLLFGYGETYEPPLPPDIIGSITILSYDFQKRQFVEISLTHDARAPEIERYAKQNNITKHLGPNKIDWAYRVGGFDLMRLAVENATGLSIDFQIALKDTVIKETIEEVFGSIEVDNPYAFSTNPVIIENKQHACNSFKTGPQKLDGVQTMCYLKGLVLPPYNPRLENNHRKKIVFQALSDGIKAQAINPLFSVHSINVLGRAVERKWIDYDFDATTLLIGGLKKLVSSSTHRISMPPITHNIYLVDAKSGDGGFTWLMGSRSPIIQNEVQKGLYPDKAVAIPTGRPDPYANNLATGYWLAVRQVVKNKLLPLSPPGSLISERIPSQQ